MNDEQETESRIVKIIAAREEILADAKGARGVRGKIPCSACGKGELHYLLIPTGMSGRNAQRNACTGWNDEEGLCR